MGTKFDKDQVSTRGQQVTVGRRPALAQWPQSATSSCQTAGN
jgi:hypothetical protein